MINEKSGNFIFVVILVFIAACQQAVKETPVTKATPKAETTGEAVVDAVGNDLTNVDSVEKDLSTDELSDLDAGLTDVQNIWPHRNPFSININKRAPH